MPGSGGSRASCGRALDGRWAIEEERWTNEFETRPRSTIVRSPIVPAVMFHSGGGEGRRGRAHPGSGAEVRLGRGRPSIGGRKAPGSPLRGVPPEAEEIAAEEGQGDRESGQGRQRLVPADPAGQSLGGRRPAGQDRTAVDEPGEVLGQLAGRAVAAPRVGLDRLEDHGLQVDRDRRVDLAGAGRLGLGDLADQLGAVGDVVGRAEGHQLVEGQAQAVDVAPGVAIRPRNRSGAM